MDNNAYLEVCYSVEQSVIRLVVILETMVIDEIQLPFHHLTLLKAHLVYYCNALKSAKWQISYIGWKYT